mgnify:CR=1 FL=1
MANKTLVISQVRSAIGRHESHKACLRGLGIRRLHQKVNVTVTPENIGMVNKIKYLLKIEA